MTHEVAWQPHPGPQTTFLKSRIFDLGFGGAWGGGKTQALIVGGLRYADHKGLRALLLRNTFPQLQQIIDRSHQLFPQFGANWVASEKRWTFPAGGTYRFGYGETYEEIQQYLSDDYTYVGYDQVETLKEERVWALLTGRIRSDYKDIVRMARCSFNPGGVGHGWVKRRYVALPWDGTPVTIDEHGNQRGFVFSTLKDNPTLMENDPGYMARIQSLPDILRRQAMGDWSAGTGIAFPQLTARSHKVMGEPNIPRHWFLFGAFDWGFGHKWAFLLMAMKPDGTIRVVDSVMGRGHIPSEIVERVGDFLKVHGLQFTDLAYTVAGSDVKIQDRARGNWGPSVSEQFGTYGWYLINADQGRIAGYMNCMEYLHQKKIEFADTPGNGIGVQQLMDLSTDPDSPNDVLKTDYNPDTNEGGDDWYDAWRYGLQSRPLAPRAPVSHIQDRINREQIFARPPEHEKVLSPWAVRNPGPTSMTRVDKRL